MSTKKALLWAAGVTVISAVMLTAAHGIPTMKQLMGGGTGMFVVAFVVLKFGGIGTRMN